MSAAPIVPLSTERSGRRRPVGRLDPNGRLEDDLPLAGAVGGDRGQDVLDFRLLEALARDVEDLGAVPRPAGRDDHLRVRRQARAHAPVELVDPDVVVRIAHHQRRPAVVGRQPQGIRLASIARRRQRPAGHVDPGDLAARRLPRGLVREHAVLRRGEHAAPDPVVEVHVACDAHGLARRGEAAGVEGRRHQVRVANRQQVAGDVLRAPVRRHHALGSPPSSEAT